MYTYNINNKICYSVVNFKTDFYLKLMLCTNLIYNKFTPRSLRMCSYEGKNVIKSENIDNKYVRTLCEVKVLLFAFVPSLKQVPCFQIPSTSVISVVCLLRKFPLTAVCL